MSSYSDELRATEHQYHLDQERQHHMIRMEDQRDDELVLMIEKADHRIHKIHSKIMELVELDSDDEERDLAEIEALANEGKVLIAKMKAWNSEITVVSKRQPFPV